jgi:uncharacterized protein (TIGR00661 family)
VRKRVLITPLDWGLGHATRCVPVVREVILQGAEVLIAGSGDSLALLRKEFPLITCLEIPGYRPVYSSKGSMVSAMAFQLPRFIKVIRAEHNAIGSIIKGERIDVLISDNRYGCWSSAVPSFLITHQTNILMPGGFGWLQYIVRRASRQMMKNFDACWIPDFPSDDDSLTGALTTFGDYDAVVPREYIGALSRFQARGHRDKKYDVVAICSGPEPQRSILESLLRRELENSSLHFLVVRGLPSVAGLQNDERIVDFLTAATLQECLEGADLVIARSGYSTVMDLQALGKNAVFIPTPGQTEQEYLASRLLKKGIAFHMKQDEFNLKEAIEQSKTFSGFKPMPRNRYLSEAIAKVLR